MAKSGRPIDPARTQAVWQAVSELVMEKSLAGLTMEGIAKHAGISKVTLYRRYGDLASLVQAYVTFHTEQALSTEPALGSDSQSCTQRNLQTQLSSLGYQILSLISRTDVLLFDTAISAAQRQYPELGKQLFACGPARVLANLTAMLAPFLHAHGNKLTAEEAAQMLFALWKSGFYDELQMTGRMPLSAEQLKQHAERKTQLFFQFIKEC